MSLSLSQTVLHQKIYFKKILLNHIIFLSNNANKHGLNLTYKIASCLFPVLKKKKKKRTCWHYVSIFLFLSEIYNIES